MTIFDMLLTKPVSKKGDPFATLGSVPQKGPSFESVLLSLLKNDCSLQQELFKKKTFKTIDVYKQALFPKDEYNKQFPNIIKSSKNVNFLKMSSFSNTASQTQKASSTAGITENIQKDEAKSFYTQTKQFVRTVKQDTSGILRDGGLQKTFNVSNEPVSYNLLQKKNKKIKITKFNQSDKSLGPLQKENKKSDNYFQPPHTLQNLIDFYKSKSVERSTVKKSLAVHSTKAKGETHHKAVKTSLRESGVKETSLHLNLASKKTRNTKHSEPALNTNQIPFAQKIENTAPLPQMQEIKPEVKENSLRSSTKQIQKPLDDGKGAVTLQKTKAASSQTLPTPQTSSKEMQSEFQAHKMEQEQKPHVTREAFLRSTMQYSLHENRQKHVLAQKSSLEHKKLENDVSKTQSLDNHSNASFATGQEHIVSGMVSTSVRRSVAPSDPKAHIVSKKGDHAFGSLKRLDRENDGTEQMPHILFEVEKPQPKAVRNEIQKPMETHFTKESNTNDSLLDHSPQSDHGNVESEAVGMTHFEERNFEQHIMQKEVRFLKIDQARVQVRLHNDQLHLDFLSQAPLMTDGVEEYVEHVMQEHGFENYRVRLKDRKRDLLIQSQKSSTSHKARSMIDVKV